MQDQPTKRFIYRGNAMPFGGRIQAIGEKRYLQAIPGAPSSALTVAGGYSVAKAEGSKFLDAFEWGQSFAQCKGELRPNGNRVTTVECSLARFRATNAPHTFTADLVHVEVVSDHPEEGEPTIVPTKIYFGGEKGLRLDDDPIEVVTTTDLQDCPTYTHFQRRYQKDPAFFLRHVRAQGRNPKECKLGEPLRPSASGYFATSFVEKLIWRGQEIDGHILHLSGFGYLHFGEVLISQNNRRVTMFRLNMGSYMNAESAGVEADPNGTW